MQSMKLERTAKDGGQGRRLVQKLKVESRDSSTSGPSHFV